MVEPLSVFRASGERKCWCINISATTATHSFNGQPYYVFFSSWISQCGKSCDQTSYIASFGFGKLSETEVIPETQRWRTGFMCHFMRPVFMWSSMRTWAKIWFRTWTMSQTISFGTFGLVGWKRSFFFGCNVWLYMILPFFVIHVPWLFVGFSSFACKSSFWWAHMGLQM